MRFFLVLAFLFPGFGPSPAAWSPPEKGTLREKALAAFKGVEKGFPGKEWISRQTGAGLAWGESYRLMAYVSMFGGTGRTGYLEKALERMETVLAFDPDWRESASRGEGWYHCDYLKRKQPLNMQNALGRVLAALWSATGKKGYRDKAEKLARFFRRRLRSKGRAWVWPYWPDDQKGVEDVSHGAINVDFAFCCFRAGIVFTGKDMLRFAGTFRTCLRPGKGFARRVDGGGDLKYSSAMAGWGHLGFVAPWIRKARFEFFEKRWASSVLAAPYLAETGRPLAQEGPQERASPGKSGRFPRR